MANEAWTVLKLLGWMKKHFTARNVDSPRLAAEVLLILVLMTFATFFAVRTLMEHWQTHGQPFDCHCEGMWNTCACSRDHIGMADMCPTADPL